MSCSLRLDRPHMAEAGQGLVRFIPTGLSLFIAVTNRRESACFNWLTSPEAAPPFRARVVSFRPVKEAAFDARSVTIYLASLRARPGSWLGISTRLSNGRRGAVGCVSPFAFPRRRLCYSGPPAWHAIRRRGGNEDDRGPCIATVSSAVGGLPSRLFQYLRSSCRAIAGLFGQRT